MQSPKTSYESPWKSSWPAFFPDQDNVTSFHSRTPRHTQQWAVGVCLLQKKYLIQIITNQPLFSNLIIWQNWGSIVYWITFHPGYLIGMLWMSKTQKNKKKAQWGKNKLPHRHHFTRVWDSCSVSSKTVLRCEVPVFWEVGSINKRFESCQRKFPKISV